MTIKGLPNDPKEAYEIGRRDGRAEIQEAANASFEPKYLYTVHATHKKGVVVDRYILPTKGEQAFQTIHQHYLGTDYHMDHIKYEGPVKGFLKGERQ